jgi:hypothetical protein
MANYVLSKGFTVPVGQTVTFGICAVQGAGNQVAQTAGAAAQVLGVYQETLDAAKVATGKATVGVQILGIARVVAGAAVSRGAKVTTDASGRAVAGGAAGTNSFGIAWSPASALGDIIEVLLTPGNTM